jgi:tetratricopeptide (TPR) repeat protein
MIEVLLQAEHALSLGLLDRAETLYGQVAAADPRNAIAVVGLARVALERDRPDAALELARRALSIDPENVAAQRLAQRLEEVLAFGGRAAVEAPQPTPPTAPARPPQATPQPDAARRTWRDRLLRRRSNR